jgi:peptidase inhibitor family I36
MPVAAEVRSKFSIANAAGNIVAGVVGMKLRQGFVVACVAAVAYASPAFAQRWGHGELPRQGACFYKDPNFRGEYFCSEAGENITAVPKDMNDEISSMRVFGGAEVTLFKDVRFQGRSSRFEADIRNLKEVGWDDLISSIQVQHSPRGSFGRPGGIPGRPGDDADRIVRRAYQEILNREPDATGLRIYRSHIIDDRWSEAQVRDELRRSPEFRDKSTMTYAKAQDVVRRAYLEVLKREPDPASRPFVDRVLSDHWSQQDVERELRNSPEYRNKRR